MKKIILVLFCLAYIAEAYPLNDTWVIQTYYADSDCTQKITFKAAKNGTHCTPQPCKATLGGYIDTVCQFEPREELPPFPDNSYIDMWYYANSNCFTMASDTFEGSMLKTCIVLGDWKSGSKMYTCDSDNLYKHEYETQDCTGDHKTKTTKLDCYDWGWSNCQKIFCNI